jgi:2-dehydro-3-deoxyphosphogluconate aldolase/(4S)-4-hydroxy-2-oxoglutarate aldolase
MPTGGVTLDNAGTWIAAGAVAVGVGTALVDAKTVDAGEFAEITERAKRIVANVQAARGK